MLFGPLPNVGIQNSGMWAMCNWVEDWEASNGHTKDTTRLFHGPWHDPVGKHICAQQCRIKNRLHFLLFLQVSQIFQRRKSDANKQDFEKELSSTCQPQSTLKTIQILTKLFCTSGPNLVILAWTADELSRRQAQSGVNFDFEGKFDLEGKGQSFPKTIGTSTKIFYIYGLNLVIPPWTGVQLSCWQASDWHTDGQTDTGNDNTRKSYWTRVKTQCIELGQSMLLPGQMHCMLVQF